MLDSRKQVFEELLWEHRDLTEAHSALQLTHSQCRALSHLTGFAYIFFFEPDSLLTAALPESSQLDELISRVAALQSLFLLPVSFPLQFFAIR